MIIPSIKEIRAQHPASTDHHCIHRLDPTIKSGISSATRPNRIPTKLRLKGSVHVNPD